MRDILTTTSKTGLELGRAGHRFEQQQPDLMMQFAEYCYGRVNNSAGLNWTGRRCLPSSYEHFTYIDVSLSLSLSLSLTLSRSRCLVYTSVYGM